MRFQKYEVSVGIKYWKKFLWKLFWKKYTLSEPGLNYYNSLKFYPNEKDDTKLV